MSQTKRTLFVDHVQRILGGAEINLLELLASTPALSLPWVVACACAPTGPLGAALRPLAVQHYEFGFPPAANEFRLVGHAFSPLAAVRAWRELRRASRRLTAIINDFKPEVVISCTSKDHFCAGPVCRRHKVRSVWWLNDVLSADFFPWPVRWWFGVQARRFATRVVTVSEFARQALLADGLAADRVVTIHNGIPLGRYQRHPRGRLRAAHGIAADEPLIGLVGRFTPWKGQHLFLRLARAWDRQQAPGRFILIGQSFNEDQAYEGELRRFVQDHGLTARVAFAPFQPEIAAALSDLDVLVHASVKPEPFGRVLIEAMAVGAPVIAARAGGVTEILTHEVDGLLVEPGDLEAYLAALRRLLSSPALSRELAGAARRTVEQRFTVERVREQFAKL
jgi:glycosyltransferase involved in cell wall biosynthesis